MQKPPKWPRWIAVAMIVLVAAIASADLPCRECPSPLRADALEGDALVSLVASTVLEDGLSLLLLGAFAVVGMPWLVAAVAIAVFYLPRWLKVSR